MPSLLTNSRDFADKDEGGVQKIWIKCGRHIWRPPYRGKEENIVTFEPAIQPQIWRLTWSQVKFIFMTHCPQDSFIAHWILNMHLQLRFSLLLFGLKVLFSLSSARLKVDNGGQFCIMVALNLKKSSMSEGNSIIYVYIAMHRLRRNT